jgi:hypothetical protein
MVFIPPMSRLSTVTLYHQDLFLILIGAPLSSRLLSSLPVSSWFSFIGAISTICIEEDSDLGELQIGYSIQVMESALNTVHGWRY